MLFYYDFYFINIFTVYIFLHFVFGFYFVLVLLVKNVFENYL